MRYYRTPSQEAMMRREVAACEQIGEVGLGRLMQYGRTSREKIISELQRKRKLPDYLNMLFEDFPERTRVMDAINVHTGKMLRRIIATVLDKLAATDDPNSALNVAVALAKPELGELASKEDRPDAFLDTVCQVAFGVETSVAVESLLAAHSLLSKDEKPEFRETACYVADGNDPELLEKYMRTALKVQREDLSKLNGEVAFTWDRGVRIISSTEEKRVVLEAIDQPIVFIAESELEGDERREFMHHLLEFAGKTKDPKAIRWFVKTALKYRGIARKMLMERSNKLWWQFDEEPRRRIYFLAAMGDADAVKLAENLEGRELAIFMRASIAFAQSCAVIKDLKGFRTFIRLAKTMEGEERDDFFRRIVDHLAHPEHVEEFVGLYLERLREGLDERQRESGFEPFSRN